LGTQASANDLPTSASFARDAATGADSVSASSSAQSESLSDEKERVESQAEVTPDYVEQPRAVEEPRNDHPQLERHQAAKSEGLSDIAPTSGPLVGSAPQIAPAAVDQAATPAPHVKLEWPSDLVQVETDPEKVRESSSYIEVEAQPRERRERPAPITLSDEPLVQVETRPRSAIPGDAMAEAPRQQRETAGSMGHV
jgi:hypothetical protein